MTAVSLLVVRTCGTVYQLHFDWTGHVAVCIPYTAEKIFDNISYKACNSPHGIFAAFYSNMRHTSDINNNNNNNALITTPCHYYVTMLKTTSRNRVNKQKTLCVHSCSKYLAHLWQQDFLRHSLKVVGHSLGGNAFHNLKIVLAENAAVGQQWRGVIFASHKNITAIFATPHHSICTVNLTNTATPHWVSVQCKPQKGIYTTQQHCSHATECPMWWLVSIRQHVVHCCPCRVGQAPCSEGIQEIASNSDQGGNWVSSQCGMANLSGHCSSNYGYKLANFRKFPA